MIKNAALLLAKTFGLFRLARWLTSRGLRILCYHGGWIPTDHHYGDKLYMKPETFAQRMHHVKQAGYAVMPLGAAVTALRRGELLHSPVVITIDDGWHSTYCCMVPVLEGLGLPATLYVTTYYAKSRQPVLNVFAGYIFARSRRDAFRPADVLTGWTGAAEFRLPAEREAAVDAICGWLDEHHLLADRVRLIRKLADILAVDVDAAIAGRWFHLMSYDEIRDALRRGVDIQLHTHRHRFGGLEEADIVGEIDDNRRELAAATGLSGNHFRHFCYPSGAYRDGLEAVFARLGIETATTTEDGFNDPPAKPLRLRRILDGQRTTQLEFEAQLSGFNLVCRNVLRRLGAGRA